MKLDIVQLELCHCGICETRHSREDLLRSRLNRLRSLIDLRAPRPVLEMAQRLVVDANFRLLLSACDESRPTTRKFHPS